MLFWLAVQIVASLHVAAILGGPLLPGHDIKSITRIEGQRRGTPHGIVQESLNKPLKYRISLRVNDLIVLGLVIQTVGIEKIHAATVRSNSLFFHRRGCFLQLYEEWLAPLDLDTLQDISLQGMAYFEAGPFDVWV